ncbi:uncharacterized protein LOC122960162 [Acropora millepora]|uniref:uncharacterized protein LOC122960162 n=1 Tax=Acropora millepora TaxID=45264 RepID=UPI001CF44749|nr:uncharacterized protein LOC122960162 [Acropora millepora]
MIICADCAKYHTFFPTAQRQLVSRVIHISLHFLIAQILKELLGETSSTVCSTNDNKEQPDLPEEAASTALYSSDHTGTWQDDSLMASAGISETSTVLDHNPESLEFLNENEPEYQQESVFLEASTQTEKTEVESVFLEANTQTETTEVVEIAIQTESAEHLSACSPSDRPLRQPVCPSCTLLRHEKKRLQRRVRNLEFRFSSNQSRWADTIESITTRTEVISTETQTDEVVILDDKEDGVDKEMDGIETCMDDDEGTEEEQNGQTNISGEGDPDWTPEEAEHAYQQAGDDNCDQKPNPRLNCEGKNYREEPKAIVFLSKLLLLFQTCHWCFANNPTLAISQSGTMLTIQTSCSHCKRDFTWTSQPLMLGKFPAGNLLLSFAILCSGASINKILVVFKHMGVLVYHFPTYFHHQRHLLIPAVVKYWRGYQAALLQRLQGQEVVLAGDGRHDSMGHSAKYGTYSIFCCTIGYIIHLVLVQANEAGSSSAMEFMGHQRAFTFLLGTGIIIKAFISDRHSQITKWMKDECPKKCRELGKPIIDHFFDLWHIGKKIKKLLTKLSKEKGMEAIGRWKKACVCHFYWCVTSTQAKLQQVILAKFRSFQYHILNQHTNIPERLFNKCAHGAVTTQRLWLTKGSDVYIKLCEALNNSFLLRGIKQASPVQQTSCLEGYHSVVNQFAPKMLAFSYLGILSRTILAALHFNWNLNRDQQKDSQGKTKLRVTYPKFKEGEGTVRECRVKQNYGYVAEIFNTLVTTPRGELKQLRDELKAQVPQPIHSMLRDKESIADAKEKFLHRKNKETTICPPTCSDAELTQLQNSAANGNNIAKRPRKTPACKKCGQPRKGHKKGQCSTPISE